MSYLEKSDPGVIPSGKSDIGTITRLVGTSLYNLLGDERFGERRFGERRFGEGRFGDENFLYSDGLGYTGQSLFDNNLNQDFVNEITSLLLKTKEKRKLLATATYEGKLITSLSGSVFLRFLVYVQGDPDQKDDFSFFLNEFGKELGYTQAEQKKLELLFTNNISVKSLDLQFLRETLPIFLGYLNDENVNLGTSKNTIRKRLLERINLKVEKFLFEDRLQGHEWRSKILKESFGPLMKIITQNPKLRRAFEQQSPGYVFKQGTDFSFTDKGLHRQLTAFMSSVARDPELMALFYECGMVEARKKSDALWEKIAEGTVRLDTFVVGLGPNAGCMAETQRMMAPEWAKNTLFVGQEDRFGGTFNLGGFIHTMGWKVNSRNRGVDNANIALPTEAGSINNSGATAMLGESDVFSGDYADDAHWGFETFIKFMFHANYLFNAKVVYQKPTFQGEKEICLQNTQTGCCYTLTVEDTEYHTGLDQPRRGFDQLNAEGEELITKKPFDIEAIRRDVMNYLHSPAYRNGDDEARYPKQSYTESFPNAPIYYTGIDFLTLCKSDVPWQHLVAGRRIVLIGSGDTANCIKEQLFEHGGGGAPRQIIAMPTVVEVSGRAATKFANKPTLRGRYQRQNNYTFAGERTNNPTVFPVAGRSTVVLPAEDNTKSCRVGVTLSRDIDSRYQEFMPDFPVALGGSSIGIDTDIVIDCAGFESQNGLKSTILDQREVGKTPQNIQKALNTIGSSLFFLNERGYDDAKVEIIVKGATEQGYLLGFKSTSLDYGYAEGSPYVTYEERTISKDRFDTLLIKGEYSDNFFESSFWKEILLLLEMPFAARLDGIGLNKANVFGDSNEFLFLELGASYGYIDELLSSRFGDRYFDQFFLGRIINDGSSGSTLIQGPAANIPLSYVECNILKERIGIPENVVARFRFEPRIVAYILQRLLEKRKQNISTDSGLSSLPGNDDSDYEYQAILNSTPIRLGSFTKNDVRMARQLIDNSNMRYTIETYFSAVVAKRFAELRNEIGDNLRTTYLGQDGIVPCSFRFCQEFDGTYTLERANSSDESEYITEQLTIVLASLMSDPLISAYVLDISVQGVRQVKGNSLITFQLPFTCNSNGEYNLTPPQGIIQHTYTSVKSM